MVGDDKETGFALGCFLGAIACIVCCIAFGIAICDSYEKELLKRKLKKFDENTGQLTWTEKAGENSGEEK